MPDPYGLVLLRGRRAGDVSPARLVPGRRQLDPGDGAHDGNTVTFLAGSTEAWGAFTAKQREMASRMVDPI